MDLTDVLGSTIQDAGFDDHELEELVDVLLREELRRRHRGARITGPTKKRVSDGGRDNQVTITRAPRIERDDASPTLTWDEPNVTWYSCKTTTRARGWLDGVKKDVGWTDWLRHRKGEELRKTGRRPTVELLQALAGGARYVLVVNEQAGSQDAFLDQLVEVFELWFHEHPELDGPLPTPPDLRQRLDLIDANQLAEVIRVHRPQLPSKFRDKLGAIEPDGLQSWESWAAVLTVSREPPRFVSDGIREQLFAELRGAEPTVHRVIRVFGAPGVGKTRAVHEGLATLGSSITARVRYCNDIRRGQDIVESGWLPRAGGLYLVLDEARTTDVPGVVSRFLADAAPTARLVLVGTSDGEAIQHAHPSIAPFHLEALADPAARLLIERELGNAADSRVESVLHLSEGFPLFAVLLAEALAKDGDAIERPSDGGTDEWLAALRVLAGPKAHYADEASWRREAEVRAKCLLVVLLTRQPDGAWDELWSEERRSTLAEALDEQQEWGRIKQAEQSCVEREILRYSGAQTRRYVSPRNLARIILNRFFDGGPHDLGPKIRRHLPQYHASLHELAELLGARPEVRDRLARGEWESAHERVSEQGPEAWMRAGGRWDGLYPATRRVPEFAASCAKRTLDTLGDEALAEARAFREALRESLDHLRHRKLSQVAFAAVESALFRLATFDREPRGNSATAIWHQLFFSMADDTHRPWDERLALLRRRSTASDAATRRLATAALGAAVDPQERGGTGYNQHDQVDGPWPGEAVDLEEVRAQKAELWDLLLARCEDESPDVAEVARAAVAKQLRASVGQGLFEGHLRRLGGLVRSWTPTQRQRVSEGVEELGRHERSESIDELARALGPTSFHERLLEHVGRWHPGPAPLRASEREAYEASGDERLIAEALEDPSLLRAEMSWLTSEAARRKAHFVARLGARDTGLRFLASLEEATRISKSLVALTRYVEGWGRRDAEAADRWLEDHARDPALATVVASVLPRLEPSAARLKLVLEVVRHHDVDPWLLEPLHRDRWLHAVPPTELLLLLEILAARPSFAPAVVMIGSAMLDQALEAAEHRRLITVLALGARHWTHDRIVMVGQAAWGRSIRALWSAERYDAVVEALLATLTVSDGSGTNLALASRVLAELFDQDGATVLWDRLARPMLERKPSWLLAQSLAAAGLLRHVSIDGLLDWVGNDVERGALAAPMANVYTPDLSELGRRLLVHFGPEGPVARKLHSLAHSTPGARVGALEGFWRVQLEHAKAWMQLPEPEVQQWATGVVESLQASLAQSEARAAFERRYG